MAIVYIVVAFFVTVLLLSIPLFPFCKVVGRIKSHHPKLWQSRGPFTLRVMTADGNVVRTLFDIIQTADAEGSDTAKDLTLVKWARLSRDVWAMAPRGFVAQVCYFFIFLFFVGFLTSVISGVLT
jgi:hypothetical protein